MENEDPTDGDDKEEMRRQAAEILGEEFSFPSSQPGELTGLYDLYLKFCRAGFTNKQALWMCVDILVGEHSEPSNGTT